MVAIIDPPSHPSHPIVVKKKKERRKIKQKNQTDTIPTLTVTTANLFFFFCAFFVRIACDSLCVHRPPVQFSAASAAPSHSRPPCLGSGAVHSLPRCLSHSTLHADHSLHSLQPPSTADTHGRLRQKKHDKKNKTKTQLKLKRKFFQHFFHL